MSEPEHLEKLDAFVRYVRAVGYDDADGWQDMIKMDPEPLWGVLQYAAFLLEEAIAEGEK